MHKLKSNSKHHQLPSKCETTAKQHKYTQQSNVKLVINKPDALTIIQFQTSVATLQNVKQRQNNINILNNVQY